MKSQQGPLDPELETLMENGRIIQRLPDVVRARALARARAAIATAATASAAAVPMRWRGLRLALAACVALALGAAGAVAALHDRLPWGREATPSAAPRAAVPARDSTADLPTRPELAPEPIAIAKPQRLPRPATAQESYAAELALLQHAHAAYAARDFSGTLILLAEHAHRFPNGRLSEERESLRVESLARSGRRDETRRVVAAFARRFPHSVLLPHLREMASLTE